MYFAKRYFFLQSLGAPHIYGITEINTIPHTILQFLRTFVIEWLHIVCKYFILTPFLYTHIHTTF